MPTSIGQSHIATKENTTKPERMSTKRKVWVVKLTLNFSRIFVKHQDGKDKNCFSVCSKIHDYCLKLSKIKILKMIDLQTKSTINSDNP